MEGSINEQVVEWFSDDLSTQSSIAVNDNSESSGITTVIIFVISAILTITTLFVMAVFIDCRQQKLQNLQSKPKKKLKLKITIPAVGRPVREDQSTILDKMECGEPSSSNLGEI